MFSLKAERRTEVLSPFFRPLADTWTERTVMAVDVRPCSPHNPIKVLGCRKIPSLEVSPQGPPCSDAMGNGSHPKSEPPCILHS